MDRSSIGVSGTALPVVLVALLALAGLVLFSRITRDQVLANERRRVIFEHIHARPGTHFRQMRDDLGIATGVLMHHLSTLEREGYLRSFRIGGKRLFFPAGVRPSERDMRDVILEEVRRAPGITQSEVAVKLNISRMLAHYYVRALVREGKVRLEKAGARTSIYASA
jgi:predicted transcriptional regulator